jgi:hypothetical protein
MANGDMLSVIVPNVVALSAIVPCHGRWQSYRMFKQLVMVHLYYGKIHAKVTVFEKKFFYLF